MTRQQKWKKQQQQQQFFLVLIIILLLFLYIVTKTCFGVNMEPDLVDKKTTISWKYVNLRKEPYKDIIRSLDKGTKVTLTGNYYTDFDGPYDWVEVQVDNVKGWIVNKAIYY